MWKKIISKSLDENLMLSSVIVKSAFLSKDVVVNEIRSSCSCVSVTAKEYVTCGGVRRQLAGCLISSLCVVLLCVYVVVASLPLSLSHSPSPGSPPFKWWVWDR